ncbi:MAG: hypothetical protein R2788_16105 [Saprospiraceae bacterium]
MKNRIFNISILLVLFTANVFAGGGWPQPKGWGYFKLSQWWLISDQHYTDVGQIDPNTTNGLFNTSLYAEYGFTNRLTGVAYIPFFSRAYFNNTVSGTTGEVQIPGEAINSFGDTDLGLKYALTLNKPVALSATLTFGLPLGNDNGGMAGALQTGDGEFNQLLQIDAGSGFQLGKISAYANVYAGLNNRTNGFSDEFRYGIEGGVTFAKNRFTAIGRLYGIKSFKNGDLPAERSNSTSVFANNSEHLTFSPELAYNINDKWGVSATYGIALSGSLIFASPSYSFGVFYKLQKG